MTHGQFIHTEIGNWRHIHATNTVIEFLKGQHYSLNSNIIHSRLPLSLRRKSYLSQKAFSGANQEVFGKTETGEY